MAKAEVGVTGSQRAAAKALVQRSAKTGRFVSPAVTKIANAQVKGSSATKNTRTTVANGSAEKSAKEINVSAKD